MLKLNATEVQDKFGEWIDYVREKDESIVVTDGNADLVKIVPIPRPVGEWKGRPVYKLKDVQHLDFPYW